MNLEDDDQERFDALTAPVSETVQEEPKPEAEEAEPPVEAVAETVEEAEEAPEAVETAPTEASEEQDEEADAQKGGVPPHRLRETAERARKAEAEAEDLKRRLAMLETTVLKQQPQQQPEAKPSIADEFFTDPDAVFNRLREDVRTEMQQSFVDRSLAVAEQVYGDEFNEAFRALMQSGDSNAAHMVMNAPDPGETLVKRHRELTKAQKLLSETGGDLEGYRERLRAELLSDPDFLKSATEAARATAQTKTASGAPHLNIPQSVNSGTRAGDSRPSAAQYLSDEELFAQNS